MKFGKLTAAEAEARIGRVNATLSIEGMDLTEKEKDLFRKYLRNECTFEEAKKIIIDSIRK